MSSGRPEAVRPKNQLALSLCRGPVLQIMWRASCAHRPDPLPPVLESKLYLPPAFNVIRLNWPGGPG